LVASFADGNDAKNYAEDDFGEDEENDRNLQNEISGRFPALPRVAVVCPFREPVPGVLTSFLRPV
jgi:hypothetical protein